MRPHRYYACYDLGKVFAIHKGTTAARRACGGRRHYASFKTLLEAEEYACWLEYEHWTYRPFSFTATDFARAGFVYRPGRNAPEVSWTLAPRHEAPL